MPSFTPQSLALTLTHKISKMATTNIPPPHVDPAYVPLMSRPTPRSESLVFALHPLIICLLLLYLLPGLFHDYTAQAVWEAYRLDTFIASDLKHQESAAARQKKRT